MADYTQDIADAKAALAEAGAPIRVRRITEGTAPNPLKPWIVNSHDPSSDLTALSYLLWDWTPGTVRQPEDGTQERNAFIGPFDFDLRHGDMIELLDADGNILQTWGIKHLVPIDPGGATILWDVKVSRWPVSTNTPQQT